VRYEARKTHNVYSIYDTKRKKYFIGGVGKDKAEAERLARIASKLGDDAWEEDTWIANVIPDPVASFGKTAEYWNARKRP
jgi:hypothetical protein